MNVFYFEMFRPEDYEVRIAQKINKLSVARYCWRLGLFARLNDDGREPPGQGQRVEYFFNDFGLSERWRLKSL
jgi:hypothetical protein